MADQPRTDHPTVVVAATAARTAAAGYPCPYCKAGQATFRYVMGLARWFRCGGCGMEIPETALQVHTPR